MQQKLFLYAFLLALCSCQTPSKHIETVKTEGGVKVIGPYSVGKIIHPEARMIYLSGAIGINPETQELISDDVVEQTIQALLNIQEWLKAAKSGLHNVIKCTVYLTDMADFAKVNEAYAKFFQQDYPARVCIAVHQLPKNARVEIQPDAVQDE